MGLLDIFKKKPLVAKESIPAPPPFDADNFNKTFFGVESKESMATKSAVEINVEPTECLLKDFFIADIASIRPTTSEIWEPLEHIELGIFSLVNVRFIKDGTINLELSSNTNILSPELKEFIKSCVRSFGPTNGGDGELTSKDDFLLSRGLFSRMWKDIWVGMESHPYTGRKVLNLTIFNVERSSNIQMKRVK